MFKTVKFRLSLKLTLPIILIAEHVALSPRIIGERLAGEVYRYAMSMQLGYYPALDFFYQQQVIDTSLIELAEEAGKISGEIACKEMCLKLRSVFSEINFGAIQILAFSMPPMRLHQKNSLRLLEKHFTPTTIRCVMNVNLIRQHQHSVEGIEELVRNLCLRGLEKSFETVEIGAVRKIS